MTCTNLLARNFSLRWNILIWTTSAIFLDTHLAEQLVITYTLYSNTSIQIIKKIHTFFQVWRLCIHLSKNIVFSAKIQRLWWVGHFASLCFQKTWRWHPNVQESNFVRLLVKTKKDIFEDEYVTIIFSFLLGYFQLEKKRRI